MSREQRISDEELASAVKTLPVAPYNEWVERLTLNLDDARRERDAAIAERDKIAAERLKYAEALISVHDHDECTCDVSPDGGYLCPIRMNLEMVARARELMEGK